MTLLDRPAGIRGWTVEIIASDISTRALAIAQGREYDIDQASRHSDGRTCAASCCAALQAIGCDVRVRVAPCGYAFERINLHDPDSPAPGRVDLIFCSNALIYFAKDGRDAVVKRLARKLTPHGRLFVGHAESLHDHRSILVPSLRRSMHLSFQRIHKGRFT
jgi:chemotaxis protein methyltransferase CheR